MRNGHTSTKPVNQYIPHSTVPPAQSKKPIQTLHLKKKIILSKRARSKALTVGTQKYSRLLQSKGHHWCQLLHTNKPTSTPTLRFIYQRLEWRQKWRSENKFLVRPLLNSERWEIYKVQLKAAGSSFVLNFLLPAIWNVSGFINPLNRFDSHYIIILLKNINICVKKYHGWFVTNSKRKS